MESDPEESSSDKQSASEEKKKYKSKKGDLKSEKEGKKSDKDKKSKDKSSDKKEKKEKKEKKSKREKKSKKDKSKEEESDHESVKENEIKEPNSDDDFDKVSVGSSSIDFENIKSNDVELWMFSVPQDFDLNTLDGKKFKSEVRTNGVAYKIDTSDASQIATLFNMFPYKKESKISLGKPFTKNFEIKNVVKIQPDELPEQPAQEDKYHQPDNLKVRFFPIGSSEIVDQSEHDEKLEEVLEAYRVKNAQLHKPRDPIKFESWAGKNKMKDTASRSTHQRTDRSGWNSAPSTPVPTPIKKVEHKKSSITKFDDDEVGSEAPKSEETPKKKGEGLVTKTKSKKESKEEEETPLDVKKRRRSEGDVELEVEKPVTKKIKRNKE